MKKKFFTAVLLGLGVIGYGMFEEQKAQDSASKVSAVAPDWAAIEVWPNLETTTVDVQPDPNRRITAIILDDSGSMGSDITAAKQAVIDALDAMHEQDRVSVVALNAGTVLPFSTVKQARGDLVRALSPITSDGNTPLTAALQHARKLLEQEAGTARGFGTFRMIVTTDGQANDNPALDKAVRSLAQSTPIQLTTIGIDITGGHVLRRSDLGSFVDVANVGALEAALEAAIAENTDFTAITDFAESER